MLHSSFSSGSQPEV
jgi:hypothetical protein